MPRLSRTLDRAGAALRRSVAKVRRSSRGAMASPPTADDGSPKFSLTRDAARDRRRDTALDQAIAALRAVVWIAAFVQGVFNEIRGRSDDF